MAIVPASSGMTGSAVPAGGSLEILPSRRTSIGIDSAKLYPDIAPFWAGALSGRSIQLDLQEWRGSLCSISHGLSAPTGRRNADGSRISDDNNTLNPSWHRWKPRRPR